MRKALVVGIDYYSNLQTLFGCVNDAKSVNEVLEKNGDGSPNFGVNLLTSSNATDQISRSTLKDAVKELFADDSDIALLYFAGHGDVDSTGGFLCSSECKRGDDGLNLSDVMVYAHNSPAKNRIILLDSCFSGSVGANLSTPNRSELTEGLTILTASTDSQYASENMGHGVFTSLLVDALKGPAANLVGDITPGSVYAHIDQSLGPWKQRPVFKTNIKRFVSLRKVDPLIPLNDLREIANLFPVTDFQFNLDPTFEPEITGRPKGAPLPIQANIKKFALLQKYNRLNLLVPLDAPHMWHAAVNSKACKLTSLGEHYRNLVIQGLI